MVMRRRLFLRSAAATVVAIGATGCERPSATAGPKILIRGNGTEPDSLDPHRATTTEAHNVIRDLYDCLTRITDRGVVAAAAAQSWIRSDNGLEYTFHLRPKLLWSNGDALTAEAFASGLRRLVDPATASQYAQLIDVVHNATEIITGALSPKSLGVEALSNTTLRMRLKHPAPYLPALLAHPGTAPLHPQSTANSGESMSRAANAVSNGAFRLAEWRRGQDVLLERNPNYWNVAAVRLDGVRFVHLADENAELRAYRANELHATMTVPRGQIDWVRDNLASELHVAPVLNTYYYGFNLDKAPFFNNPGLRRALSMVIDRERLATSVLRMGEPPAYSWVPPGVDNYAPQSFDYARLPLPARISEAKHLYEAAGYSPQNPLRFTLSYNAGEVHSKVAVAIASMWKDTLGVQTALKAVELRSLLSDIERREFDIFRLGWQGDYNDAYTFLQFLKGDFGVNLPRFRNPEYDKLLESASRTPQLAERRALLERAERTALAEHPLIPLYFYVSKHLVKPVVQGWYSNAANVVYSADLGLQTA